MLRKRLAGYAVVLCSAVLLTSCSSSSVRVAPDPAADASEQAMAAYWAFRDAELKIYSTGSLDGVGDIKTIARGEALKHIQRNLAYFRGAGLVMKGRPVLSPKVQSVDLNSAPPTARIRDCQDSTNYVSIDKFTGEFKFPGNPPSVGHYIAERVDSHWIISDLASYSNEKC